MKSARGFKQIAELNEVGGNHCFEHAQFRNEETHDRGQSPDQTVAFENVVLVEEFLNLVDLVKHQLEPQLEDLMHDDKQRFIVSCRIGEWMLQ